MDSSTIADGPPRIPSRSWYGVTGESLPHLPTRLDSLRRLSLSAQGPQPSGETFARHSKRTIPRSVSFDSVEIRCYERILDINPCTSSGPSVGLGWKYVQIPPKKVDEVVPKPCTSASSMVLSRDVREAIVRDLGYSQREIASAIRISLKAKNQRRQTVNNLHAQRMEEMVEKSSRKVKRLLRIGVRNRLIKSVSVSQGR